MSMKSWLVKMCLLDPPPLVEEVDSAALRMQELETELQQERDARAEESACLAELRKAASRAEELETALYAERQAAADLLEQANRQALEGAALFALAKKLTLEQDERWPERDGECKRAAVYAQMTNSYPDHSKREVSMAIEKALQCGA